MTNIKNKKLNIKIKEQPLAGYYYKKSILICRNCAIFIFSFLFFIYLSGCSGCIG